MSYTSDAAAAVRRTSRQARLRREADQRARQRQKQRQQYLNSQIAAQRYMHMAYANGAKSFRPDIYERATAGNEFARKRPFLQQRTETKKMSNQNYDNPFQIDRIRLNSTKEGKPVVELFSEPLQYPALTLFESQFGMLFDVSIDPNQLEKGANYYTRFLAHWQETEKTNGNGNPYKNVSRLEARTASQTTDLLADILLELKAQTALLLTLAENSGTTHADLPPAEPAPATNETKEPPAAPITPENETGQMFDYTYGNGEPVAEPDRAIFNAYKRAHREKPAIDKTSMDNWYNYARK